jgi:hypothetical protein
MNPQGSRRCGIKLRPEECTLEETKIGLSKVNVATAVSIPLRGTEAPLTVIAGDAKI